MHSQQFPNQAHSSLMRSARQAHQLFSVMLLFCSSAQSTSRNGAFIGYTERAGTACRDNDSSCGDWASKGECTSNPGYMMMSCPVSCEQCTPPELDAEKYANETLVLETELGKVYMTMLWDNAPRAAALIMDLAHRGSKQQKQCRFYRSEAAPLEGGGPPYGLLQGSLAGILKAPPSEGNAPPKYGHAAMILGTTEFYIALMDHLEWAGAHSVWGKVEERSMETVHRIVSQSPYTNYTHPVGTLMRMMSTPVPFRLRVVQP
ncbi:hypothetical protein DUNSADRAFT_5055 [Dunaliella salina]|uniref:ShKT domain-containing protein n=1 Tax=Dunaliella salina TaxID=3046 RepID=A0ABQ7HAE2_DUNSA|nr:hypothetical protein DUNSADRAFT_5055 [Dunaliella salina]|eukprot:KAF5843818.1 hypothetical protein DUNSADRAFT_5055 [Dunaliella salina]